MVVNQREFKQVQFSYPTRSAGLTPSYVWVREDRPKEHDSVKRTLLLSFTFLFSTDLLPALDDGLARTPPMGWSS